MTKFIGGVVVGIFLGALAVEVLTRKYPDLIEKAESKGRRVADVADDVFRRASGREAAGY